ncbi:MAG: DNA integrity scanning diadenylate cyclase DisA [Andreesenia angusta]|nr:DNA integrity scanning diadenylate cyclase DisA [Andreesenia angusta]
MKGSLLRKDKLLQALKVVAPGTVLREGLENVVRAGTGALIVIGDSDEVMELVDGGFKINTEVMPANIYELAKMDGAIIISEDLKKILRANAQLVPPANIASRETGTRHRTAERVARQTGKLVISISQRRNVISLYMGSQKYIVKNSSDLLNKANQALQTLEKYRTSLDQAISNLSMLEFNGYVTVYDVVKVLQRTEMFYRVVVEIERYILELGNEGRLVEMQLDELKGDYEVDGINVIRDYIPSQEMDDENSEENDDQDEEDIKANYLEIWKKLGRMSSDEILSLEGIARVLGYAADGGNELDMIVIPRGYRILSKIPRLPFSVIENTVEMFGSLRNVMRATIDELDAVDGIGEIRAKSIKDGLKRLKEMISMEKYL